MKKFVLLLIFVSSISKSTISTAQLKFCAAGDVLFDRSVRKTIEKHGVNYLFARVKPVLSQHDLCFCNLECPLIAADDGYPLLKQYCFRADTEFVAGLKYAGFQLVSVANNHTIDWGREGFVETMQILKRNQIFPVGGGNNQREAIQPVLIHKNGLKFAFFGAVSFLLEAMTYLADKPAPAFAGIDELTNEIQKINNQVDFVVVSFHWGIENNRIPNSRQIEYAHRTIDAGADLVLGHHPHILQPIEIYKNRLIFYSLGNFVFDNSLPEQKQTIIFSCEFQKGKISSVKLYPIVIQDNRPQPAVGKDFQNISHQIEKLSKYSGVRLTSSTNLIHLISETDESEFHIPIKEWHLRNNLIRVYTNRLALVDTQTDSMIFHSIKKKKFSIRDACLIQDSSVVRVYAIAGESSRQRGKQLAVFPIDLNRHCFNTPLLDSHDQYNPWKICAGDVDGDGNAELLVGVWKSTKYFPDKDNRLFAYNRYGDTIYPKWLGSTLGFPFIDFAVKDFHDDGKDELVALAISKDRKRQVMQLEWNEFGFDTVKVLDPNYQFDTLLNYLITIN